MKQLMVIPIILTAITGLLFSQGIIPHANSVGLYNLKDTPPLGLTEAYSLALAHLGTKTNSLHCFSASCLERPYLGGQGWTFSFANTNGEKTYVAVTWGRFVATDPQNYIPSQEK